MTIGSNPLGTSIFQRSAPIAQLDRVSDYESGGCEFDSCWARHLIREIAQLGSAPDLGSGGRRFESCFPDHWGCSSPGRALDLHSRGSEFDPRQLHQNR